MLDVYSYGVLHDLAVYVSVATAVALFGYRMLRQMRPEVSWNHEGSVLSRPYGAPDLLVLAGIGLVFILSMQPQKAEGAAAAAAVSDSTLIVGMIFNLIVCAGLLLYLFQLRGLNPAELFGLQQVHWRSIMFTVGVFSLIILLTINLASAATQTWLQGFWPDLEPQETVKAFQESDGIGFKLLVVLMAVVIAPLAEETMFRGFVYGVLKRYTDAPFAALASSLMFAIIHLHVGSLLPLWMLAVLFCLAYEITGCLLAPMILHAIFNGVSILAMMFVDK
ncbi:CPBP family intramembrane glutamic endopeptidase [Prosthecobacter vanneervenii]|uniref:Membrane protease YdiL (CAAX protease family) n=1 Tax=Prosthecobacter vanneervenii TaxID=48466 RepID=A0A7W8DIE7_9BACT|nr:type II CAAX endopeptidase family protein [Prosthecobacter vanneervenii]MBB5030845.1 membrane protease YdiL (CAAX protease family) [Prosthecobacter vanneervenii]